MRPDVLCVLGRSFRSGFPLLERDVRALDPHDIATACRALGLAPEVRVVEVDDLPMLRGAGELVVADDEVMRHVADTYLAGAPVSFESTFLRWDRMAAVTAHPVDADSVVSESDCDRELIRRARQNAQRSSDWWRQVGAVLVRDGEVLLEGHNRHQPTENAPYIDGDPRSNFNAGERIDLSTALHGEAGLIARAAHRGISLEGASIYVTTFPCPGCAMLIIQAGVTTVYYADGYSNLGAQEHLKLAGVKLIRVKEA